MEAERLAIHFEETGAYHYRQNQEMKARNARASRGDASEEVGSIGDDDEDELYEDFIDETDE